MVGCDVSQGRKVLMGSRALPEQVGVLLTLQAEGELEARIRRPLGLVRYDSLTRNSGAAGPIVRPRVIYYSVMMVGLATALRLGFRGRQHLANAAPRHRKRSRSGNMPTPATIPRRPSPGMVAAEPVETGQVETGQVETGQVETELSDGQFDFVIVDGF